jgi:hypothetical protein
LETLPLAALLQLAKHLLWAAEECLKLFKDLWKRQSHIMLLMDLNHIRERLSSKAPDMSKLRSLRLEAAAVETLINNHLFKMMGLGALQVSKWEVEPQKISLA